MLQRFIRVVLLSGLLGFVSLSLAQAVYEPEAFEFTTGMGDITVSPVGILEELRSRYQERGQDLDEADARLVPLEITLTSDMGLITIDLTGLNVRTLNITAAMADIAATLPESGSTSGTVITDMGNVTLQIPASRSLAVVESVTDMGDISIVDTINQEAGGDGAVTLKLRTGMGDISIVPLGEAVSSEMDEDVAEDSDEVVIEETSGTPEEGVMETVSSVMLSDGTEYFPVMATDFAGEVVSFSAVGDLELSSAGIIQELINMNLARDMVIDETTAKLIPLKIVLDSAAGNMSADLTGLNVQVLELNVGLGAAEVTLPAEGETTTMIAVGGGSATLNVPPTRSVTLAEGAAGLASITVDESLTTSTTNPVILTADVGLGSISVGVLK
jgi:hypothetical protein